MLRTVLLAILLLATCLAQVAPDDVVLSVRPPCGQSNRNDRPSDDCEVSVSRRQLDDLLSVLSPASRPTQEMKAQVAHAYARLLALDRAARDLGLDHSAPFQARMRWLEAQTLADLLRRRLESETSVVPDADLAAYYSAQRASFEEVRLRRLVLPKSSVASAGAPGKSCQQIAAELRNRAAHGENVDQLQRDGYEALGLDAQPPATDVGTRRKATLPSSVAQEVFSLQPGEVSQVEDEDYSLVIYKVEERRILPLEQVRDEIRREIARQKLEQALESITGQSRVELNQHYFEAASRD